MCPDVKKGSWTADEDRVILESVREFGTRWSHIAKLMPGRTDNSIKNRWNSAAHREPPPLPGPCSRCVTTCQSLKSGHNPVTRG